MIVIVTFRPTERDCCGKTKDGNQSFRMGWQDVIEVSAEQFKRFQALIYRHSGIRLDDRKQTLLTSRLQRRLRVLEMEDVDHYFAMVNRRGNPAELQELLDVITTNETSFFRTQQHFDWFSHEFITQMVGLARKGRRKKLLRLWSAACSIGAEPYTLLFCLHDHRAKLADWKVEVLASDLSQTSLNTARQARFGKRLIDGLSPNLTRRFFRESTDNPNHFQVREEFRNRIDFFQHNLMRPLNRPPMDCIF